MAPTPEVGEMRRNQPRKRRGGLGRSRCRPRRPKRPGRKVLLVGGWEQAKSVLLMRKTRVRPDHRTGYVEAPGDPDSSGFTSATGKGLMRLGLHGNGVEGGGKRTQRQWLPTTIEESVLKNRFICKIMFN